MNDQSPRTFEKDYPPPFPDKLDGLLPSIPIPNEILEVQWVRSNMGGWKQRHFAGVQWEPPNFLELLLSRVGNRVVGPLRRLLPQKLS